MATVKGNGHDPLTERMVDVLERILKEAQATNAELKAVREEVHAFREETRDELFDIRSLLKTSIEERLSKLEAAVFPPKGSPAAKRKAG
jgi:hypothetical protein